MSYRRFLSRIQRMFGTEKDARMTSVPEGLKDGRLKVPSRPMTDQELARSIREFQSKPVPDRRFDQK